jgi:hypothetical protein
MDLQQALTQIGEIRQRVAGSQVFRGYRSATVAFSGLVAAVTALAQNRLVPRPGENPVAYVRLWFVAAGVGAAVAAGNLLVRYIRCRSPLQRDLTVIAVGHLAPSLLAGLLVTLALMRFAPASASLLPGLWAIFLGLGIFASRHVLSGAMALAGGYYLIAGLCALALGQGSGAFSPWAMGLIFAPGQWLTAALLHWTVERTYGRQE